MRVKDLVTGLALIGAGAAVALEARGFPKLAGMDYGPDLFPTIAAVGMAVCGLGVLLEGLRAEERAPAAASPPAAPRRLPVAALLGVVAGFALLLPWLGFHLSAAGASAAAALIFGARWPTAAALAVAAPVLLHALFYTVLRTPLPWGVLTPIAW